MTDEGRYGRGEEGEGEDGEWRCDRDATLETETNFPC